jgi:hypothetical protein
MSQFVDTGKVFKRDYLFTLRAIADNAELKCPACGTSINMRDDDHRHLVGQVRETLQSLRQ